MSQEADPGALIDLGLCPLPTLGSSTLMWLYALLADAGLDPESHAREGPADGGVCLWARPWLAADLFGVWPTDGDKVARWRWLHAPGQADILRAVEDLFRLSGSAAVRVYLSETRTYTPVP